MKIAGVWSTPERVVLQKAGNLSLHGSSLYKATRCGFVLPGRVILEYMTGKKQALIQSTK